MEIKTYWYWSKKVYGYYSKETPDKIFINTRTLPRFSTSLINTFFHEACHCAGFSHGLGRTANFYYNWKSKTVPYYIGNFISGHISPKGHDLVEKKPWYKKLFF